MTSQSLYFRQELQKSSMGYIKTENIKVLIGSWNVNAKFPSHTDILNWVLNRSERPEIIVVGRVYLVIMQQSGVILFCQLLIVRTRHLDTN